MQLDVKSFEVVLINSMVELAGGCVVEFDFFFLVVQVEKVYVIKGDLFKAEIFVGIYSFQINLDDINIYVNGSVVFVGEGGKVEYIICIIFIGNKQLKLKVEVCNLLIGEVFEGESIYEYEVGICFVIVFVDKMNVFYIGVDNFVFVLVLGVFFNDFDVWVFGCFIWAISRVNGKYFVMVDKLGDVKIIFFGGGLFSIIFDFCVKKIFDLVVCFFKFSGGIMGNGIFKV